MKSRNRKVKYKLGCKLTEGYSKTKTYHPVSGKNFNLQQVSGEGVWEGRIYVQYLRLFDKYSWLFYTSVILLYHVLRGRILSGEKLTNK